MATGTIMDLIANVRTVLYTHSAATIPGDVIVGNGALLIAINTRAINVENAYVCEGKMQLPKETSLAVNVMNAVFWDAAAGKVTTTSTGNTPCGHCAEKAAGAEATIVIDLNSYVKA